MKTFCTFLLLTSLLYACAPPPQGTSKNKDKSIQKAWATGNPEIPEADEYDIRLTMDLRKGRCSLYNSRHSYPHYTGYEIKGNTLVLLRDDSFKEDLQYRPVFTIKELNQEHMVLEAENWAAVYITSVLSTLWVESTETDWVMTDSKDLSYGGMLQTGLELRVKP